MTNGHVAEDMCKLISNSICHRLGNLIPAFLEVRQFMECKKGNGFWFPYSVLILQLVMREAIFEFLNGTYDEFSTENSMEVHWEDIDADRVILEESS